MKVKSVKISDDRIRIIGEQQEFYLKDGKYRNEHGETITIQGNQIVSVFTIPDIETASKAQLENFLEDMEQQIASVGDDAQLANIDLQNMLQKQQQTTQMLSNISKVLHDTAMAIVRKIG